MEGINKEIIESIAAQTEGFSGREITKMVIAWHDAAFTVPDAVLTPEIMTSVLGKFHLQHKLKANWTSEEQKLMQNLLKFDGTGESDLKI
jgi:ATPase family AAA domain-containing protein 3A/B